MEQCSAKPSSTLSVLAPEAGTIFSCNRLQGEFSSALMVFTWPCILCIEEKELLWQRPLPSMSSRNPTLRAHIPSERWQTKEPQAKTSHIYPFIMALCREPAACCLREKPFESPERNSPKAAGLRKVPLMQLIWFLKIGPQKNCCSLGFPVSANQKGVRHFEKPPFGGAENHLCLVFVGHSRAEK